MVNARGQMLEEVTTSLSRYPPTFYKGLKSKQNWSMIFYYHTEMSYCILATVSNLQILQNDPIEEEAVTLLL